MLWWEWVKSEMIKVVEVLEMREDLRPSLYLLSKCTTEMQKLNIRPSRGLSPDLFSEAGRHQMPVYQGCRDTRRPGYRDRPRFNWGNSGPCTFRPSKLVPVKEGDIDCPVYIT